MTYRVYLVDHGKNELLRSSSCPAEIRRVACSRKLARRCSKSQVHLRIERDGRTINPQQLDTICYLLWLEHPTVTTPWS